MFPAFTGVKLNAPLVRLESTWLQCILWWWKYSHSTWLQLFLRNTGQYRHIVLTKTYHKDDISNKVTSLQLYADRWTHNFRGNILEQATGIHYIKKQHVTDLWLFTKTEHDIFSSQKWMETHPHTLVTTYYMNSLKNTIQSNFASDLLQNKCFMNYLLDMKLILNPSWKFSDQ